MFVESRALNVIVQYDVVLSAAYQVPVLYFMLRNPTGRLIMSIDEVYDTLVPRPFKHRLLDVGIMGAISMAVRVCDIIL